MSMGVAVMANDAAVMANDVAAMANVLFFFLIWWIIGLVVLSITEGKVSLVVLATVGIIVLFAGTYAYDAMTTEIAITDNMIITADTGVDEEFVSTLKTVAASDDFTDNMRDFLFSYEWHLIDDASITNDYIIKGNVVTIYVGSKEQYKYRMLRVLKFVTWQYTIPVTQEPTEPTVKKM